MPTDQNMELIVNTSIKTITLFFSITKSQQKLSLIHVIC